MPVRQKESDPSTARKPRADGARNREQLLEAAKHAFADQGSAASLEGIARTAGVSIASLYRHFPTRDLLIEAAYRQETDLLVQQATRLMAESEPLTALREWLTLFVDFLDAKHNMAEALETLIGGPELLYSGTPARLAAPVTTLVERAAAAGAIGTNVEPLDLLRAIAGVANAKHSGYSRKAAIQMVELLLKGLQADR